MSMVRFDPFRDLAILQDRMNRLFNEAHSPRQSDDLMSRGTWTPAVDIYEVDGALVLKAELPDMRREDIDVSVENNTLTIRGERKLDHEIKQESFHRIELAYGSFVRSFSLPHTVDATKIGASFDYDDRRSNRDVTQRTVSRSGTSRRQDAPGRRIHPLRSRSAGTRRTSDVCGPGARDEYLGHRRHECAQRGTSRVSRRGPGMPARADDDRR